MKNFHHNSNAPPPYQPLHQNPTTPSSVVAPQLPPAIPSSFRDIDLVKLGLNMEDMPNLQANNTSLSSPEDVIKCLQAIYGKNSAEILQKLPPINDWPMQSVSPPDFPRVVGGGSSGGGAIGGACSSNSVIGGCSGIVGSSGGASGAASFSNNINNGNSSQQKQDIAFASAQHPSTASAINHHFRVSTTNTYSPQQQQQQLSQQKSVLSLHQHHQNDSSNRRLNHQHNLSTTNTSFANLSAAPAVSTSSSSTLDTNSGLSTLGGNLSCSKNSSNSYTASAVGLPPHVPNIMDTIGSTMDNIFFDSSLQQASISKDTSPNQQQSLIKHQQLQRLLKATGSHYKSSSSHPSSSTNYSHRNDSQNQRNIINNNNNNSNNMSQIQRQLTSPISAISPPQPATLSTVPKSLLNLAACSSPSNNASNLPSGSKFSNIGQFNLMPTRQTNTSQQANLNNSNSGNTVSNNRTLARSGNTGSQGSNGAFNQKGSNGIDPSNLLQHMTRSTNTAPNTTISSNSNNLAGLSTRSSLKQQLQLSLLSEDQTSSSRNNLRSVSQSSSCVSSRNPQTQKHQSQTSTDDALISQQFSNSKEAYLASLQERAARAGVSIGEINKPVQSTSIGSSSNCNIATNPLAAIQQSALSLPSGQSKEEFVETYDRREIESALSRVEARNDLSLLYPPMLLASNSQRQINALSAGLQGAEDSELFTNEVKKIVLEECNIIYECKECNNLFRSLANLVKHKRTYCVEHNSERTNLDMNRRANMSAFTPLTDQSATNVQNISLTETNSETENDRSSCDNIIEGSRVQQDESGLVSMNQKYNLRGRRSENPSSDMRTLRLMRNQEKRDQRERETSSLRGQFSNTNGPSTQTSLSKLLQSQPKNRLPVTRDSALMGALNMAPVSVATDKSDNNNSLRIFEGDRGNVNCSFNELNEQLVRNSSLAKTLLNEKVKSIDPKQSVLELSKTSNDATLQLQDGAPKRIPKRKFLEDCIQKVKRDKLRTEDDTDLVSENAFDINAASSTNSQQVKTKNTTLDDLQSRFIKDPLSVDDSDADSDMLMIDLDGPNPSNTSSQRSLLSKKSSNRRASTAASSTASSSSSAKLNTSSALLKALTRPVDPKSPYPSGPQAHAMKPTNHQANQNQEAPEMDQSEVDSEKLQKPPKDEQNEENSIVDEDEQEVIEVFSPLFDKYTCDICEEDYKDQATLMSHTLEKHTTEKMVYPCIFCSFSFITLENVCRHIVDIHKKPKAQVHRLKEVVRSRSYVSNDFSACSDNPPMSTVEGNSNVRTRQDEKIEHGSDSDDAKAGVPSTQVVVTQVTPRPEHKSEDMSSLSNAASGTSSTHSSASTSTSSGSTSESGSSSSSVASLELESAIAGDVESQDAASNVDDDIVVEETESPTDRDYRDGGIDSVYVGQGNEDVDDEGTDGDEGEDDGNDDELSASDSDSSQSQYDLDSKSRDLRQSSSGKHIKMSQRTSVDQDDNELGVPAGSRSEANSEDNNDDDEEEDDDDEEDEALPNEFQKTPTKSQSDNSKPNLQTTPPSSSMGSGGGSGGIMKLKIQLKTQPDEKSKVYRIV